MHINLKYSFSDADSVVKVPHGVVCAKCDLREPAGRKMRKFDAATYYHDVCPDIPLRVYSTTRRNATDTTQYPYILVRK